MKMNKFLGFLLAALLAAPLAARAEKWQMLTSHEGRFNVLVPGVAEHKDGTQEWQVGTDSDISYYLNYTDLDSSFNGPDKKVLEAGVQGGLGSDSGLKLLSKRFFSYKGYSAAEAKFVKGDLHMTFYIVVVRHRVYTEGYGATTSKYKKADADKFLNSLVFLNPELNTGSSAQASTDQSSTDDSSSATTQRAPEEKVIAAGQTIVSPEGRFSLQIPYDAKQKGNEWSSSNPNDTVGFFFSYTDMPSNDTRTSREILNGGIDGAVKATKATLKSKKYFKYQGFDATEYEATDGSYNYLSRNIVVNHRFYVAVYTGTPDQYSMDEAERFFLSLKLTNPELNTGD